MINLLCTRNNESANYLSTTTATTRVNDEYDSEFCETFRFCYVEDAVSVVRSTMAVSEVNDDDDHIKS